MRSGVENGQYIPDHDLYIEFKNWFFRRGGPEVIFVENRWFFYYVRECLLQFRRDALQPDYEPWKDKLLDLGGPDSCDEFEAEGCETSTSDVHWVVYGDEVDNWERSATNIRWKRTEKSN